MRLVQWKQIDRELRDAPVYTGSLSITGSIFLNDVNLNDIIEYSIFRPTGSFYATTNDIQITGSLTLELDGVEDYFTISVQGIQSIAVNTEGTLQLSPQNQPPTAVTGGIYYNIEDEYYLGYNN
jgi:hypothetical protein